jgi:alkanesulfonate monooxygenase SsuD/methylene tetrahydromethanopterin reductase-like flavin-dependent oxidoreductase (luciferase family)
VPLAKILAALDLLSDGRVIAGLGPGSSPADYEVVGIPFEQRWRASTTVVLLRQLLRGDPEPAPGRFYPCPAEPLLPLSPRGAVPLWLGSWGSAAGLRRVARLGDGWLASAYNTTADRFGSGLEALGDLPNAMGTAWLYVTEDAEQADAERMRTEVLAPFLSRRRPSCAPALRRFTLDVRQRSGALAGCRRVHFWPLNGRIGSACSRPSAAQITCSRVVVGVHRRLSVYMGRASRGQRHLCPVYRDTSGEVSAAVRRP